MHTWKYWKAISYEVRGTEGSEMTWGIAALKYQQEVGRTLNVTFARLRYIFLQATENGKKDFTVIQQQIVRQLGMLGVDKTPCPDELRLRNKLEGETETEIHWQKSLTTLQV